MWRSKWRCVIKPAYSFSFLLSINVFVWQNVLYFLDAPRILQKMIHGPSNVKSSATFKAPRLHPFVLLLTATCRWRLVWSVILTRENQNTRNKNLSQCHFVHHKSHTWSCLGSKAGPSGDRSAFNLDCYERFYSCRTMNTLRLVYKEPIN